MSVSETFTNKAVTWVKDSDNTSVKTPAPRTVYMDSNIALTDGKNPLTSGDAKTIPNLFEAIYDMDTRIESINMSHGPSTADAGLYVTSGNSEIIMSPMTFNPNDKQNAESGILAGSKGKDGSVFRISAPNIEFEVNGTNNAVTGYFVKFTGASVLDTIQTVNGITLNTTDTYALVPVAGSTITDAAENKDVAIDTQCNLFKQDTDNSYILVVSHMKVTTEMALKYTKKDDAISDEITIPSVMRYRLGAIIEAIQELNRRTMFMDTNMPFASGISYGDTTDDITNASHEAIVDGLPGASGPVPA